MHIFETLRRASFFVVVVLSLSACAPTGRPIGGSGRGGGDDPFAGSARRAPESIQLQVQNLNFNEARLYTITGGRRRLLGSVQALGDHTFEVPWDFTDRLRIEIDLVTGPSCVTRELQVDPGEILRLQIQSVLSRGGLCR